MHRSDVRVTKLKDLLCWALLEVLQQADIGGTLRHPIAKALKKLLSRYDMTRLSFYSVVTVYFFLFLP